MTTNFSRNKVKLTLCASCLADELQNDIDQATQVRDNELIKEAEEESEDLANEANDTAGEMSRPLMESMDKATFGDIGRSSSDDNDLSLYR